MKVSLRLTSIFSVIAVIILVTITSLNSTRVKLFFLSKSSADTVGKAIFDDPNLLHWATNRYSKKSELISILPKPHNSNTEYVWVWMANYSDVIERANNHNSWEDFYLLGDGFFIAFDKEGSVIECPFALSSGSPSEVLGHVLNNGSVGRVSP